MIKEDIATDVRLKTGMNQKQSREAVAAVFNIIGETLAKGGKVDLRGFGAFSILKKNERKGRNPKTGEPAVIKARATPKFKASKTLKVKVNNANRI